MGITTPAVAAAFVLISMIVVVIMIVLIDAIQIGPGHNNQFLNSMHRPTAASQLLQGVGREGNYCDQAFHNSSPERTH